MFVAIKVGKIESWLFLFKYSYLLYYSLIWYNNQKLIFCVRIRIWGFIRKHERNNAPPPTTVIYFLFWVRLLDTGHHIKQIVLVERSNGLDIILLSLNSKHININKPIGCCHERDRALSFSGSEHRNIYCFSIYFKYISFTWAGI